MTTNEPPIIFSGNSPALILAGKKTQTRRVIVPQPHLSPNKEWWHWTHKGHDYWRDGEKPESEQYCCREILKHCRYQPGMRAWVREAYFCATGEPGPTINHYKADGHKAIAAIAKESRLWRSPIYMPWWVSRISIDILSLRVERLQDITLDDVQAEGIWNLGWSIADKNWWHHFGRHWDGINKRRGYSWESNPWVYVIDFALVPATSRELENNGIAPMEEA